MNKRKAIRVIVLLFAALASYTTWCTQKFWLQPWLKFDDDVPQSALDAVKRWKRETGGVGVEPFSMRLFVYTLSHPYEANQKGAKVVRAEEDEVWVWHHTRSCVFLKRESGWAEAYSVE